MKKYLFLWLFVSGCLLIQAQVNTDSLRGVWNDQTATDTSRIQAINDMAKFGYLYSQPDSAFYFAQLMYDFASSIGLKKDMANALSIQAGSFYVRSDFNKAIDFYQRSLNIYKDISDKKGMSKTLNNIGVMYSNLGDFVEAMDFHKRSLAIKEEIQDKSGMAGAMNNIGLIYMNQGDYPNALKNFQNSLNIKEEFGDKRGIAQCLNNIGLIYMRRGDYSRALEHFQRSLSICEQISDKRGSAGILSNIGLIYKEEKKYSIALDYAQRSLVLNQEIADRKGMASSFNNIGEIYFVQGDFSHAMEYYRKSLEINEEISEKQGMAGTLINIGRAYNEQGNQLQAITWCKKGLKTAKEINIIEEQRDACDCLYDAYKAMGINDKALEYHESITALNESLQADETTRKLQQMEFSKQMIADSLIHEEEKLRVEIAHDAEVRRKNRIRNIFIISAVFLLIGLVGLYMRVIYIRKAKKAIEREKDRSDGLLLNILPAEIAEELKEKGKADARKFENVSILFTDFKEFTQISEQLSAEELVGEINTCFESFDDICKKYGIEKIKTIGDSYMAAGGLPVPSDDSVNNTVMAGLEMASCMVNIRQKREIEGKTAFEMRVGIHTGPVIAGIVGVTKFQYDIWGDTVNIASRMENSGVTGKVNISKSTYELIKDDPAFKFHSRGKIQTKGKGEMEMWFVERA
jgi:class 3 adenylate cyclase/Tfp pilus assembly protein PilF